MTFAEMGDMLRAERLRRNLSIEEVAELLKLSPRLIRGIEAGDESALPHTVYVRGFVRSYARLLEIELESIAEQPIIFATESAEPTIQTRPMQAPSRTNWGLRLLVLVCALGFAGYWYYHTQLSTPQTQVAVPPTSMVPPNPVVPGQGAAGQNILGPNVGQDRGARAATASPDTGGAAGTGSGTSILSGLASGPTQAMSSGAASGGTSSGATAQQGGQAGNPQTSLASQTLQAGAGGVFASPGNGQSTLLGPSGQTGQAVQAGLAGQAVQAGLAGEVGQLGQPLSDAHLAAAEEAPVATRGFSTNGLEVPVSGGTNNEAVRIGIPSSTPAAGEKINQLMLTGVAECWVHTTADGTQTRQFSIQKGETFSLSFNKNLVVKLGNAGGVRMKYNGADLPAPGKEGQVLTLQFPQAAGR